MKKTLIYCLLAALCLAGNGTIDAEPIHALRIGDAVPARVYDLLGMANTTSNPRTAVLIDFWELSCGNCIAALPKLDSLQKKYAGKLQIITVTSRYDEARIRRVLDKYPRSRGIGLPILTGDSLLRQYFPFELVSHLVWINNEGRVKAITGTAEVNSDNLAALITHQPLQLPVKQDIAAFDYNAPLVLPTAGGDDRSRPFYYSGITGRIDGIDAKTSIVHDSAGGISRYTVYNMTLLQLGRLALENSTAGIAPKLLDISGHDPGNFICPPGMSRTLWKKEHTYCFSLQMPLEKDRAAMKQAIRMQLGLALALNFGMSLQKTDTLLPCLLLKASGATVKNPVVAAGHLLYNNLSELTAAINESSTLPIAFNETGIHDLAEMKISIPAAALTDAKLLAAALAPYGMSVLADRRLQTVYRLKKTR